MVARQVFFAGFSVFCFLLNGAAAQTSEHNSKAKSYFVDLNAFSHPVSYELLNYFPRPVAECIKDYFYMLPPFIGYTGKRIGTKGAHTIVFHPDNNRVLYFVEEEDPAAAYVEDTAAYVYDPVTEKTESFIDAELGVPEKDRFLALRVRNWSPYGRLADMNRRGDELYYRTTSNGLEKLPQGISVSMVRDASLALTQCKFLNRLLGRVGPTLVPLPETEFIACRSSDALDVYNIKTNTFWTDTSSVSLIPPENGRQLSAYVQVLAKNRFRLFSAYEKGDVDSVSFELREDGIVFEQERCTRTSIDGVPMHIDQIGRVGDSNWRFYKFKNGILLRENVSRLPAAESGPWINEILGIEGDVVAQGNMMAYITQNRVMMRNIPPFGSSWLTDKSGFKAVALDSQGTHAFLSYEDGNGLARLEMIDLESEMDSCIKKNNLVPESIKPVPIKKDSTDIECCDGNEDIVPALLDSKNCMAEDEDDTPRWAVQKRLPRQSTLEVAPRDAGLDLLNTKQAFFKSLALQSAGASILYRNIMHEELPEVSQRHRIRNRARSADESVRYRERAQTWASNFFKH